MTALKKIPKILLLLFLFFVLILFACFPARYMQVFFQGVSLWAVCVLPSALPFLFLTGLITRTGGVRALSRGLSPVTSVLFRLSGVSGYCLLMSFLSGYPVGAKLLADLKENGVVSPSEATKMSVLCSSSGPLFVLGSVGSGMFGNAKIGWILLLSHYLAVLIGGIALRFYPSTAEKNYLPALQRSDNLLYDTMYSSVLSALCVGGFIAVFYTLSFLLADWNLLKPLSDALALCGIPEREAVALSRGLVEMTGGCKSLADSAAPCNIALCAFLITFGGLSVLVQQIGYLKKAEVSLRVFLPVKLLQALISAGIAFLLASITA